LEASVITVGNYDGIHLGHQDVFHIIVDEGKKEKHSFLLNYIFQTLAYVLRTK